MNKKPLTPALRFSLGLAVLVLLTELVKWGAAATVDRQALPHCPTNDTRARSVLIGWTP